MQFTFRCKLEIRTFVERSLVMSKAVKQIHSTSPISTAFAELTICTCAHTHTHNLTIHLKLPHPQSWLYNLITSLLIFWKRCQKSFPIYSKCLHLLNPDLLSLHPWMVSETLNEIFILTPLCYPRTF